jgi:ABC-type transport system involved in cytochrome c biogenesis permease subunit
MLTAFQSAENNAAGVPHTTTKVLAFLIGVRMRSINGTAITWVAVYAMLFPVSTLYTGRVIARNVRDNLRLILVPLVAGISVLVVTWSCESTRAP